jgi:beta-N-acetylhexosaminidase
MTDMSKSLLQAGIDVNCAPVMDILFPETHAAIGDRAYSSNPETVFAAADTVCKSFLDAGITPVIKHLPGHGRAIVDSHVNLPQVDISFEELDRTDFEPFRRLARQPYAASVWGMVGHIVYSQLDHERPASISPIIINEIIRKIIGFDGLLFSDDLDMKALEKYGSIAERARESLHAGCDLALYCWAELDVMEEMASTLPPLSAAAWTRWETSLDAHWMA